jgi:hypothetical protein
MCIRWISTEKSKKWCEATKGLSGMTIEKICGSVEGVSPIDRWEATLKEQSAKDVDGAKYTHCFTVLLRGVWARHAEDYTLGKEERVGQGVIELVAIVALDGLNRGAKLCAHISKNVRKSGKSVRLKAKRKCPNIVRTIIKNNKIIFITGHTCNG